MNVVAIELRDRRAYVAVNIQSRELCKQYGDPPGSTIFFQQDADSWVQIKKEDFPSNGKANVLANPWGGSSSDDVHGLVSNKDKHLVKPFNDRVNQPLEKVLSSSTLDACYMFQNEGIERPIQKDNK